VLARHEIEGRDAAPSLAQPPKTNPRSFASIENCSEGMGHQNQSANEETEHWLNFGDQLEIVRFSGFISRD
jgi:hypothetical protein